MLFAIITNLSLQLSCVASYAANEECMNLGIKFEQRYMYTADCSNQCLVSRAPKFGGHNILMIQQNCIVIWVKIAYFGPELTQSIMLIRYKKKQKQTL